MHRSQNPSAMPKQMSSSKPLHPSYYHVSIPSDVVDAVHDRRYTSKIPGQKTALRSHHMGHTGYMAARDVPSDAYLEGLSTISGSTSVMSLMSEDDRHVRDVFQRFYRKLQEEVVDPTPPGSASGSGMNTRRATVKDVIRGINEETTYIEADRELETVVDRELQKLVFRCLPWRCVFQTWVRSLTDELVQLRSRGRGNTLLTPIELFLRRSREACITRAEATATSPELRPKRPRSRQPGVGGPALDASPSMDTCMISYTQQVPHPLAIACAVYTFDVYLIPLLGEHQADARRAFHEMVLGIYHNPPHATVANVSKDLQPAESSSENESSSKSSTGRPALLSSYVPTLTHDQHEASVFLRPTFLQSFHELKAMYLVLRESNRKQQIVMERQENILQRSLLRMQMQTGKRLIAAWHAYTVQNKKLRERYKKIFLSLSDSATVKVTIKTWLSASRALKASQRSRKSQGDAPHGSPVSTLNKQLTLRRTLTVLIQQKQLKMSIMEDAIISNRRLAGRKADLEGRIKAIRDRTARIATTWATVVDDLIPAPPLSSQTKALDKDQIQDPIVSFETRDELLVEMVQWIVEVSRRDEFISGKLLAKSMLALAGSNSTTLAGVVSRSTHMLPILRNVLTILAPPADWVVQATAKPDASLSIATATLSDVVAPYVAFDFGDDSPDSSPTGPGGERQTSFSGIFSADEEAESDAAALFSELAPGRKKSGQERRMSLNVKHAALSAVIQKRLDEASTTEEVDQQPTPSRRTSTSIVVDAEGHVGFQQITEEEDEEAHRLAHRKSTLKSLQSSFKKSREADALDESLTRKASSRRQIIAGLEVDPAVERQKQLEAPLKPLADLNDATGLAQLVISLLQRISRAGGLPFTKILPPSYSFGLSRSDVPWRNLLLSYAYMTQWGNNSGCFKLLPTSKAKTRESTVQPGSPAVPRAGSRLHSIARKKSGISFAAGSPEKPLFENASQMKALWDERRRTRKFSDADNKAIRAMHTHEAAMSVLVDNAMNGGEVQTECARVYELFSAACPTVSNNRVITADFMASKLRILFPERNHWRQANVNRKVTSAKEMEEYLKTMCVATQVDIISLCDRLIAAVDDTDHFFAAISSREVQEAFESSLPDLSVIFSLYAVGDLPNQFIALDGWMQLIQPFIDTSFNQVVATDVFHKIRQRNSVGVTFREIGGDTLSVPTASSAQRASGLALSSMAKSNLMSSTEHAPGEAPGLDMDAFCQALCAIVPFKIPSPFIPLEAKVSSFIDNWLIPMAGAKVKTKGNHPHTTGAHRHRKESIPFVPLTDVAAM